MKKIIISSILLLYQFSFAQDKVSVEKSIFGIQTGLLGIWGHNESRLSDEISLRTEIGLDAGIFGGDLNNGNGFLLSPVVVFEPRWYYNLEKRNSKGKKISNNSGNFLTVRFSYHPDWFVISNKENIHVIPQISIIPKWGIKRTIGNHFTYETGIGIGYRKYLTTLYTDKDAVALDLHLKVGYTF